MTSLMGCTRADDTIPPTIDLGALPSTAIPATTNEPKAILGAWTALDVPTMCERLQAIEGDPVAGPARALGAAVRDKVVRWHHSQKTAYRGISLYYQPVKPRDIERSFIMSGDAEDAAKDAAYYAKLALCEATGWHRLALNPLPRPKASALRRG